MASPYELSPATIARVEKHAKPFVDTFDNVINRVLDTYELHRKFEAAEEVAGDESLRTYPPETPPNLTHTKVLSVDLNKIKLARSATTWNALLNEAVRLAKKKITSDDKLKDLMLVNYVVGKKDDEGYRYLPDADISVQGQDANAAWKATFHIVKRLDIPVEVIFAWRLKADAENPGLTGRLAHSPIKRLLY